MIIKSCISLIFILALPFLSDASIKDSIKFNTYSKTLDSITLLIEIKDTRFINVVTLVENTYSNSDVNELFLEQEIKKLVSICKSLFKSQSVTQYKGIDKYNYLINFYILKTLSDTIPINSKTTKLHSSPFTFNHSDPLGKKDITNTFVSKLLTTHQGNCKSLTYLYKILADELGAKCWIALAPGHMYIKNYSQKIGWYNTELTSGTFPTDAWIMTTSYINPTAVMSGMYMDTLSNQQAIALCVLDLAHLYERETKNYYDGFIIKCCDLVLQYHPVNPMVLLLKAETLKKVLIREKSSKFPKPTNTFNQMEATYLKLFELGYREMPLKMKRQKQKEEKENLKKYLQKQIK